MRKTRPQIRYLVLILSVWLLGAQTLVLAHDATHAVHIHKQFCDDMEAISGNLIAAIADYSLPESKLPPVAPATFQSRQSSNYFVPVYQSRAPPSFTA